MTMHIEIDPVFKQKVELFYARSDLKEQYTQREFICACMLAGFFSVSPSGAHFVDSLLMGSAENMQAFKDALEEVHSAS